MATATDLRAPGVHLFEEALAAAKAGRHDLANDLLNRAAAEEHAADLARAAPYYWADKTELYLESADGTGPCSVFELQVGFVDMPVLARLINHQFVLNFTPRTDLTERTRFVDDSEYLSGGEPFVVLHGFELARIAAEILNSQFGPALVQQAH